MALEFECNHNDVKISKPDFKYKKSPTQSTEKAIFVLIGIFLLSLGALFYLYKCFPELEKDEAKYIKLPMDIDDAKNLGKVLARYQERYYYTVLSAFFLTYIFLQSFAIPGSIFLSILSGFLFPFPLAIILVCTSWLIPWLIEIFEVEFQTLRVSLALVIVIIFVLTKSQYLATDRHISIIKKNYKNILGPLKHLQSFAIPGSVFLSILSGFLYPSVIAIFIVCTCSALGASFCYLLSSQLGRKIVQRYFPVKAAEWSRHVKKHESNLLNYMIFLRITPLLPNWFINITSPVVGVPAYPFILGTFIGVAPPSILMIQAGTTLHELTSSRDAISGTKILILSALAVLSLLPILFKKKLEEKLD